jgi:hypothetical protein
MARAISRASAARPEGNPGRAQPGAIRGAGGAVDVGPGHAGGHTIHPDTVAGKLFASPMVRASTPVFAAA